MGNPYRHPISTPVPELQGIATIAAPSGADQGEVERQAREIAQRVVPYDGHSPYVTQRQRERRSAAKQAARLALAPKAATAQPGEGRA